MHIFVSLHSTAHSNSLGLMKFGTAILHLKCKIDFEVGRIGRLEVICSRFKKERRTSGAIHEKKKLFELKGSVTSIVGLELLEEEVNTNWHSSHQGIL